MRRLHTIAIAVLLVGLSARESAAQVLGFGPLTTNQQCVNVQIGAAPSVSAQVTGTWTGTITFGISGDGGTYVSAQTTNETDGESGSSTTANGIFSKSNTGFQWMRACATAAMTGTANVSFTAGTAGGGGGGGGSLTGDITIAEVDQGDAGASAWLVNGSGVTQPISSTVLGTVDDAVGAAGAAGTTQSHLRTLSYMTGNLAGSVYTQGATFDLLVQGIGALRDDTLSALVPAEGEIAPLRVNGNGALHVVTTGDTALQLIDDAIFTDDAAFSLTSSKVMATGCIRDDALATVATAETDVVPCRVSSTGAVWGAIASIAAGDTDIGNVDLEIAGTAIAVNTGSASAQTLRTVSASDSPDVASLAIVAGDTTDIEAAIEGLDHAEDAAHSSGQFGVMSLAVRQDSQLDFGADGDYVPFSVNADGELRVAFAGAAGGTSLADDGDFTAGTTTGTPAMGFYQSTVTACTDGDSCTIGLTTGRAAKVHFANADGSSATIASDMTVGSAFGTTGPGMLLLYQDFDGAALATPTNVGTELEAVPWSASIKGIPYVMLVNEDGSGAFGTTTTPWVVGDGAGALNIICDSGCSGGTQYAEDAVHASGNTGTLALGVRNDAGTALAADGDNIAMMFNASGALYVAATVTDGAGALNTIVDSGTVTTVSTVTTLSQLGGVALPIEDAAETAAGVGIYAMAVRRDAAASSAATTGDNATINLDALGQVWTRQLDPCSGVAKTHIPINITTATTTELTAALAGASNNYYVCSLDLVTAAANNVALVDDDTDNCASVTSGLAGGTTAASGWNYAANGGLSKGDGNSMVYKSGGTNRVLCLVTSAATQLSGSIQVVAAP